MISQIINEFINRQRIHGLNFSNLRDALQNKPIMYSGGGAMYPSMRIKLSYFTDIRMINKELLDIPYIKNKNIDIQLFAILATSYGLSIQLENEIRMTPIEKLFEHLPQREMKTTNDWRNEHGLLDT
jgi:hypothetical protein